MEDRGLETGWPMRSRAYDHIECRLAVSTNRCCPSNPIEEPTIRRDGHSDHSSIGDIGRAQIGVGDRVTAETSSKRVIFNVGCGYAY